MSAPDRVYTFECSAKAGGQDLAVSGVTINMPLQGIPDIQLNVDPFHTKGQSPKNAMKPSLATYFTGKIPEALYDAARKSKADATFSLKAKSSSDNQEISCKDWVVDGAGYNAASSLSMEGFALVLRHPLLLASRSFPLRRNDTFESWRTTLGDQAAGMDVLEFMYAALDQILTVSLSNRGDKKEPLPSGSDDLNKLTRLGTVALDKLKANLSWEQGASTRLFEPALHRAAMTHMLSWLFNSDAFCPLQAISSLLGLNYFLRLAPGSSLSEPMSLGPMEPWGDVGISLDEHDLHRVQPSAMSINNVSGLGLIRSNSDESAHCGGSISMAQYAIVEPRDFDNSDKYPPGPVKAISGPPWLSELALLTGMGSQPFGIVSPGAGAETLAQTAAASTYSPLYSNSLRAYLQSALQLQHWQDRQVLLQCRLLLTKDGKLLRPGVVFEVTGSGSPLFYFYCTKVVHQVNVATAEAYSIVQGAYFRSPKGGSFEFTQAKGSHSSIFHGTQ